MLPQIEFLGKVISMYGLMAFIGGITAGTVFCFLIRKRGLDDNPAIAFLLFVVLGIIIGSHLLFGIVNFEKIKLIAHAKSIGGFVSAAAAAFGGSVFYGGLFGGMTAGIITIKIMKLDKTVYSDCMAPIIPFFHFFARIGCFFAGCCYGIPSKFGFITTANRFIPGLNGTRRFPVQLLEAALNLILSAALFYALGNKKIYKALKGKLVYIYLIMYSAIRFFDEFLRGDSYRGYIFGLSVSQLISIGTFVFSAAALLVCRIAHKKLD